MAELKPFHRVMPDGSTVNFTAQDKADAQRQFDTWQQQQQAAPATPAPRVNTAGDIALGFGVGAARGVADVPGAAGNIGELTNAGLDFAWNTGRHIAGYDPSTDYHSPKGLLPTGQDIRDLASRATNIELPNPVTPQGKFAERIGSAVAPAIALGGPGGILARGGGAVAAARAVPGAVTRFAVAPVAAGEGAYQGAKALGAPEGLAEGARVVGEIAGTGAGALTRPTTPKGIRSTGEIKNAAGAFYDASEKQGVQITPQGVKRINFDLADATTKAGFNEFTARTMPKLVDALTGFVKMENAGVAPTLRQMDQMRSVLSGVIRDGTDNEARIASAVLKRMDATMDKFRPGVDVVGGNSPSMALRYLKEGRRQWGIAKKNEAIDHVMHVAEVNASGRQGTSTEKVVDAFRQLARNEDLFNSFSAPERAGIMRVISGGPVGSTIRTLAKLLPNSPWGAATMGASLTVMGHAVPGAILTGAGTVGAAAKVAAGQDVRSAVGNLRARTQGVPTLPPSSGLAVGATEQAAEAQRREPLKVYVGAPAEGYR